MSSEFVRFISPEAFESGLSRRLLIGEVAVGQICKIRIEDMDPTKFTQPIKHVEATISILDKISTEQGSTLLRYKFEASDVTMKDQDTFNADSIAFNRVIGLNFRTYLSDELDPRWDASLSELADLSSDVTVH